MLTFQDAVTMASILCAVVGGYFLCLIIRKCGNNQALPTAVIVAELTQYTVRNIDTDSRCPICKIRVSNVCFIPCQHALCNRCSAGSGHHCPICNAITGIVA